MFITSCSDIERNTTAGLPSAPMATPLRGALKLEKHSADHNRVIIKQLFK